MNVKLIEKWIKRHEPQGATKLAAAAEISPATLSNIRRGIHSPNLDAVRKLAKAMNVSLDELCFHKVGETPPVA